MIWIGGVVGKLGGGAICGPCVSRKIFSCRLVFSGLLPLLMLPASPGRDEQVAQAIVFAEKLRIVEVHRRCDRPLPVRIGVGPVDGHGGRLADQYGTAGAVEHKELDDRVSLGSAIEGRHRDVRDSVSCGKGIGRTQRRRITCRGQPGASSRRRDNAEACWRSDGVDRDIERGATGPETALRRRFGAETCGSTICISAVRPCSPSASVTAGDKVDRLIWYSPGRTCPGFAGSGEGMAKPIRFGVTPGVVVSNKATR